VTKNINSELLSKAQQSRCDLLPPSFPLALLCMPVLGKLPSLAWAQLTTPFCMQCITAMQQIYTSGGGNIQHVPQCGSSSRGSRKHSSSSTPHLAPCRPPWCGLSRQGHLNAAHQIRTLYAAHLPGTSIPQNPKHPTQAAAAAPPYLAQCRPPWCGISWQHHSKCGTMHSCTGGTTSTPL
jgi:hypothetical protein